MIADPYGPMLNTSMTERSALASAACLALLSLFFCFWASIALGRVSAPAVLAILALLPGLFGTGFVFFKFASNSGTREASFSIILVTGGLLVSIALYALRALTPLGIISSSLVIVLFLLGAGLYSFWRNRQTLADMLPKSALPEVFAIALIGLAITFWCQDLFAPFVEEQGEIILHAWPDTFYHLSQISIFSITDAEIPLSDVQFVLAAQGLYHYGSYTAASLFSALSNASPMAAYSSVYVPLGLLFAYLAAYGIAQEFFGSWPAFVATTVLATLPDPSFYGLGNPFFGYNWLQQIAPSGAYGVACACVALYFILKGIVETRVKTVMIGFLFVVLTALFKAQIFVPLAIASPFLAILFYGTFKTIPRAIALVLAMLAMLVTTELTQKSASVPTLRLDGSSLEWYRIVLLSFTPESSLKTAFSVLMGDENAGILRQYVTFAFFTLFSTLGVFGAALLALLFVPAAMGYKSVKFAPLLVVAIYLILASGLALEKNSIGTPEEFLHRHFVWAYFIACTFSIATLAQLAFKMAWLDMRAVKLALVGFGFLFLSWPLLLSTGIQSAPYLGAPYPRLSVCEVGAARFLSGTAAKSDIIHNTAYNIKFRWSGLSGLRAYITDSGGYRMPGGAQGALDTLKEFENPSSQGPVSYLRAQGVDWLISKGPVEGVGAQAFHCGDVFISKI